MKKKFLLPCALIVATSNLLFAGSVGLQPIVRESDDGFPLFPSRENRPPEFKAPPINPQFVLSYVTKNHYVIAFRLDSTDKNLVEMAKALPMKFFGPLSKEDIAEITGLTFFGETPQARLSLSGTSTLLPLQLVDSAPNELVDVVFQAMKDSKSFKNADSANSSNISVLHASIDLSSETSVSISAIVIVNPDLLSDEAKETDFSFDGLLPPSFSEFTLEEFYRYRQRNPKLPSLLNSWIDEWNDSKSDSNPQK